MLRTFAWIALAALAGCQAQNPYAAFGPNRVPTPGTAAPAPYYPPTASAAPAAGAAGSTAGSSRMSISVDSPSAPAASTSVATDATDKSPIRIVENPEPAVRTATTGTTRSGGTSSAPATNGGNSSQPAPTGKSSRSDRASTNVVPASYEQTATAAAGVWKSR